MTVELASAEPAATTSVQRARHGTGLAVWLSAVCLFALFPLLAFSAVMLHREVAEVQKHGLDALGRRARAAAASISHELDLVTTELGTVALQGAMPNGDLRAAYDLAVRVVESDPRLASISLSTASGRQPFITSRPFGTELPDSNATALLQPLFEGADRVVSPLIVGAVSQKYVIGLARPLDMGPHGIAALRAVVRLDTLDRRFNEHDWPADWTAAVIDQNGTIIARSHDAERFVGKESMPGVLEHLREDAGVFRATTKDGIATMTCGARVPGTPWYVVVGRPVAALEEQTRDAMAAVLAAGALCALLGVGAAVYTARWVGHQLRGVVDAHVGGVPQTRSTTDIREIREVEDALAEARAAVAVAFAEVDAARQQALRRLSEREEMLDVLAHEVRQPLNNASAALQQANKAVLNSGRPAIDAPLSSLNSVLTEVTASIDNTLAVAGLLVGDRHISRVDVDIDTLVRVAIADMAADQSPRVRVERTTDTRTVSAEPSLLRLALRNLLSNALKFSPQDAPVTVRIMDSDEPLAVIFDVIDTGTGIGGDQLSRLFDRGGRKGQHLGGRRQGLGLYIVRRVMQLHGGTVALVRNGPDGTTMRLTVVQSIDP